jgi:hypothetical protein
LDEIEYDKLFSDALERKNLLVVDILKLSKNQFRFLVKNIFDLMGGKRKKLKK